jgi:hypothetical protein
MNGLLVKITNKEEEEEPIYAMATLRPNTTPWQHQEDPYM